MFTVKHINIDGNENMVECHQFVRERRSDGFTQFLAYGENPMPNDYIATWCGDEEQRTSSLENRQTIYVMNRYGATVATYHFRQPDFCTTAGPTEPEKLAA